MFTVTKSIDIDFGHHVSGHAGACINVHGHTWKFEAVLQAEALDPTGFVVDFGELKRRVLQPIHELLDHSMALSETLVMQSYESWEVIGRKLVATRPPSENAYSRMEVHNDTPRRFNGAYNLFPGGIKFCLFPFSPTSERLAQWAFQLTDLAMRELTDDRVSCRQFNVYETLHPVEAVASFIAPR